MGRAINTLIRSPYRDWSTAVADRLSGRGPLGPYETPPGKLKAKPVPKPKTVHSRRPRARRRVFD